MEQQPESAEQQPEKMAARVPEKAGKKVSPEKISCGSREERKNTAAAKKTTERTAPAVSVQALLGGTITTEEIVERVMSVAPDAVQIYVKTEKNRVYWVSKESTGSVKL